MQLEQLDKHIHITQLPRGVEVMYAGQPCLNILEGDDGYIWRVNPLFAKLTYGANVFEDVPFCMESSDTIEEAIALGLESLHSLGAFSTAVSLPEDSYVEEHLDESVTEDDDSVEQFFTSLMEDCRTEALKHSNNLLEAHDLANGLFESFLDEMGIMEGKFLATHKGEDAHGIPKPNPSHPAYAKHKAGKDYNDYVDKAHADLVADAKHNNESVEESAPIVKITTVDGNKALRPGTKHEHQVVFNHGKFKAENSTHEGATVHTVKQPNGFHGVLVVKDKAILASNQNNMSKDDALKFGQHLTKSGFVGASKFGIHLGSAGSSVHEIGRANESTEEQIDEIKSDVVTTYSPGVTTHTPKTAKGKKSLYTQIKHTQKEKVPGQWKPKNESAEELDEAYGATKKAYDPFASAISKVMSRPAFSAVTKDEPEAPAPKKKTGRPTTIDLDVIKDKAKENIKAGKPPTHGMERNEKVHWVRHLKDHPDVVGTHVSKAGRHAGTTKADLAAKADAIKASKIDNVMTSWLGKK